VIFINKLKQNTMMKTPLLLITALIAGFFLTILLGHTGMEQRERPDYEFQQFTTIESVVPGGTGRSRLLFTDPNNNRREETMNNFFSLVGINFGNIHENEEIITAKITELSNDGWDIVSVTPGVYASDSGTGIFITRYLFQREKRD
jgi:hypothetical protein